MMPKIYILPICAFYINLCTFGFIRSGGVLYMSFVHEFNCTYAQASWSIVLVGSLASFAIFVAGFLTHYFEKRSIIATGILLSASAVGLSAFAPTIHWIIFLSVIQGIGIGFFGGLLPIIISENLDEGRSFACGLSYSGATLAAFIFPPLLQTVIDHLDIKTALFTLSLIAFSSLPAAWPLKSNSSEKKMKLNTYSQTFSQQFASDFKVLKLFPFWIVTVIYIVFIYVFMIFLIILPDFAVSRNVDKKSAVLLVSIYSVGDFLGRLAPGYLHLKNLVFNQTLYLFSIATMACLFILIEAYAISFVTFAILCIALGFVTGIQMTLPAVVMVELIGVEKTTIGFGFSNILSGLIALSRPLLIDYVKASTNSYDQLLIINALLCIFATIPWYIHKVASSSRQEVLLEESVLEIR